jgi:hypothetical protein
VFELCSSHATLGSQTGWQKWGRKSEQISGIWTEVVKFPHPYSYRPAVSLGSSFAAFGMLQKPGATAAPDD